MIDTVDKPKETKDEKLWNDFKAGNHEAFESLMQQHYRFLYNYGFKLYADGEFIKDCIQDVFLNLWQYRSSLSAVQSPKFYLLKALRQKIFKDLHKDKWFREADEIPEEYAFDVQFTIENLIIEQQTTDQNSVQIKKLLEQLTKRQREAIYLKFYQGLDYEQIAEIMAINSHSATNLVYDAIKFLRKNWVLELLFFLGFFLRR